MNEIEELARRHIEARQLARQAAQSLNATFTRFTESVCDMGFDINSVKTLLYEPTPPPQRVRLLFWTWTLKPPPPKQIRINSHYVMFFPTRRTEPFALAYAMPGGYAPIDKRLTFTELLSLAPQLTYENVTEQITSQLRARVEAESRFAKTLTEQQVSTEVEAEVMHALARVTPLPPKPPTVHQEQLRSITSRVLTLEERLRRIWG